MTRPRLLEDARRLSSTLCATGRPRAGNKARYDERAPERRWPIYDALARVQCHGRAHNTIPALHSPLYGSSQPERALRDSLEKPTRRGIFERARRAVLARVATRGATQVITDTAELDFRSSTEVRSPNARDAPRSNYRLDVDRARAYSRRVAARAAGQTITDGVEFDHHSAGYRLSTGNQGLRGAVAARARALSTVASTGTLSHLFRHTSEFCVSVEDFSSSTALGRPDFQSQCRLRRHCD